MLGRLRKSVFGISARETTFERRGFRGGGHGARERLERIGPAFVGGYHAALENPANIIAQLSSINVDLQGFAYEGAAMGLALLDYLTPWNRCRIKSFLRGAGDPHAYMVHVAIGWLLPRLPMNAEKMRRRFDPLLGWLIIDGYGFHEGFFRWPKYINGQPVPRQLNGYSKRVFDQGLGRSFWFVDGADVELIPQTIAGFPQERHADLWSGAGLACAYAGGTEDRSALEHLRTSAAKHLSQLAQGIAFAAKARLRAGNVVPHTRLACEVICGMSAEEAANVTDAALENLPADGPEPAYEVWRRRIQEKFLTRKELER